MYRAMLAHLALALGFLSAAYAAPVSEPVIELGDVALFYRVYDAAAGRPSAEQLQRARRFLEAVVPEAEKANVRLALHPNDPPVPISRGSEQLMATFDHWKQYLNLVKSPFNGMTFDCGVNLGVELDGSFLGLQGDFQHFFEILDLLERGAL